MGLLEFLKKNKKARKIFGKKELEIIKKQIMGVSLSASEKTRLSRDIRKKFKFIKEAAEFSKEFDLKKGIRIKNLINKTLEEIKKSSYFPNVKEVILFGSAVEKRLRFDSDIDIAVKFEKINKRQATKFRIKMPGRVPSDRIDIQVYNVLPKKVQKEIDEKGKVLYKK